MRRLGNLDRTAVDEEAVAYRQSGNKATAMRDNLLTLPSLVTDLDLARLATNCNKIPATECCYLKPKVVLDWMAECVEKASRGESVNVNSIF